MFGYVRPLKPELLVREYTRYRSVYCGLCKQIGHDYGQIPRLALGYDLTLLAVLLLSLSDEQPPDEFAGCILNPVLKKTITRGGPVLELCAALSVMLAWHKANDNVRDEKHVPSALARNAFAPARRLARRRYPEYDHLISDGLVQLARLEAGEPDLAAAAVFGSMLQQVFRHSAALVAEDAAIREAIGLFGYHLGCWIYILDAIDDLADDCNNGSWNPLGRLEPEKARMIAESGLQEAETAMDRTAALLPYRRDSGLLSNIVNQGLPAVRRQIFSGIKLTRL